MAMVQAVNINKDTDIVQIGSGNVVNSFPSGMTVNMKLKVDSHENLTNFSPSINIIVGKDQMQNNITSTNTSETGTKVNVIASTMTSFPESSVPDEKVKDNCLKRLSGGALKLLGKLFPDVTSYDCCVKSSDTVTIKDRLNITLDPGDVLLVDSSFVLYMGDGFIIRRDTEGMVVKEKLKLGSEFEKWELWNNRCYNDYYSPPERVARAYGLIDLYFEGHDSDFIAWSFTGMNWAEAAEIGFKLHCR